MPDFPSHSSSTGDMRLQLQHLLDTKEKQLQQAGALGQRVLAQQVELEERVRQLQELDADKPEDEEIDADMRERYRELAEAVRNWDSENIQLSSAFGPNRPTNSSQLSLPFQPEPPREEPERPKASAGTSAAQSSRRAKNAAHRADDVEFAFEIGSGLLTEVRRLQSLLGERDKAIQDMKEEKDDLDRTVESLRNALKAQEQSTDKYKEENWNLEVTLQELRTQLTDTQSTVQRLEGDNKRLTRLLNNSREATDQHKNESERLKNALDELKAKHETDIAHARKHAASLQRDKSDLQQSIDNLKADLARQGRRLPRFGSPLTPDARDRSDLLTPADREDDDVFSVAASTTNRKKHDTSVMFNDGEYDTSPDVSPSRPFLAPNHPSNEVEALQQRLAHAQRQINTLKGTLQREKELKIEYRRRLDGSPVVGAGVGAEEDVSEGEAENEAPGTGKRRLTPYRAGRGRGRGRGRGGLTLMQRLESAARSPASEYDEDEFAPDNTSSPPPPVPAIPKTFVDAELDEEFDDPRDEEPTAEPISPPSNRTSVDGMDPAFANILRRSSSSGSIPYNRSPLRNAVVARTLPRRSRGGAAFQEARPPSLVGQPEALAAELGFEMAPVAERAHVETAEFACQTEPVEEEKATPEPEVPPPPIQITPAAPETAEMGIQVEPEVEPTPAPVPAPEPVPEPTPKVETADSSMQTDPEPVPEPAPIVEHAEMGIQHEPVEAPRVYAEACMETEPEPAPVLPPAPTLADAEVQTPRMQTTDIDVQTAPEPAIVAKHVDADIQATPRPPSLGLFDHSDAVDLSRRDTLTQASWARDASGDTTIRGLPLLATHNDEGEFDDNETETGAETDTDTEYHDARQSIIMATPTTQEYATSDFHSMQTMTDNEMTDGEDDAESIKASRVVDSRASSAMSGLSDFGGRPQSFYQPPVTYESKAVSAELLKEPEPVPEPEPEPPKPELKEMSIQTDAWVPTPPASPAVPVSVPVAAPVPTLSSPPHPTALTPGQAVPKPSTSMHQFQYISPPSSAGPSSTSMPVLSVPPSPAAIRDSVATIVPRPRTSHSDRRQSIESTLSGAMDDSTPRSRLPSTVPTPDKSRPPMMMLPPPPRAPPPPNSMPPPQFIPERRMGTMSSSSYDVPPGRPASPPPPELIQRATTPTFGTSLRPGFAPRSHGSSMPPSQQGLRQPPSTNSFRSAANAANYAQTLSTVPAGLTTFARDRGREMSSTSLHSDHSLGSGRSSMSSDHHFFNRPSNQAAGNAPTTPGRMTDTGAANGGSTDPTVIHAITQTMIGEFLYKYTRRAIGKGHGEKRHKRFFWVHPYTKTLYWSSADPGSTNVFESSAKSAYIEAVRSVLDPNPMPPGLYQYSVVVSTPQREMKITAPTKERHDIWLNALKYLLARPNPAMGASPANGTTLNTAPLSPVSGPVELHDEEPQQQLLASPQSFRSVASNQSNGESWNITPRGQRSHSQLSVGGSIGKRSGTPAAEYLRWAGSEGPYSPTKSFEHVPAGPRDEEELDFELHDDSLSEEGFQGLENVRACCDGRHTVGRSEHDHHHHHHHHHHNQPNPQPQSQPQPQNGQARREPSRTREHLEAHPAEMARPASPAWSFRSRAGSATSHDGGLFSGKLRFGSRRSKAPVVIGNQD
ncbi:hypothetical protein DENSPDRAFT_859435 [Dentipellis sp. KUC8613]|nr:hypothetical protein DENSPDRAFT_859435 [Dentipellis sp. KUC8613]